MMTPPFLDATGAHVEGSVAEILSLQLGGVKQTVILRGLSTDNPVLLFLHGGPGTSEFNLIKKKCPELEEIFTVAHWEQRGSGLSYSDEVTPESMTTAQLIEDAHALSGHLRERFDQSKIFLMGHSWGTLLGIQLIHKYPDPFVAFISMGQAVNALRSEQVGYDWLLARLEEANDEENLAVFSAHPTPDETMTSIEAWGSYLSMHRPLCMKYGGSFRHEEFSQERMVQLYNETPEYGEDGWNNIVVPGLSFTLAQLIGDFIFADLTQTFTEFEIPIYMLQGIHDYQTAHQVAKQYFETIHAPHKRFVTFEDSAHTPFHDEPERFMAVIQEILAEQS